MIYRFAEWELDTGLFELRRGGEQRKLEPRVFNLIELLVRNRERVVSRDEILAELWPGRVVTDATLSTCVKSARQALGDDGRAQRLIRTVQGRGFRFVGSLEAADDAAEASSGRAAAQRGSRTALALLPLDVFSDDRTLDFLADALVEDLTTAMARMPSLLVISRASSFVYKGKQPSARQVGAELAVDCMLEGSLRPLGDRLRINVQLIDTADGSHLWAQRFDRPAGELAALQDEIVTAIARLLEPELERVAYQRVRQRFCDGDAWALYQQASGLLALKGWHPETFSEAAALLNRSIEMGSDFAVAHAYLALIHALGHRLGLVSNREQEVAQGLAAAERALALDDSDSTVLGFAGCALADLGQGARALPVLEKAVELDPSNAQAWTALGAARLADRQPREAVEALRHGMRISPLDNRLAVWGSFLALALMLSGRLEEAVGEARVACRRDSRNHIPWVVLAGVRLAVGDPAAASQALAQAFVLRPQLSTQEIASLLGRSACAQLQQLDAR